MKNVAPKRAASTVRAIDNGRPSHARGCRNAGFPAGLLPVEVSRAAYVSVVLFDGPNRLNLRGTRGCSASTFSALPDASRPRCLGIGGKTEGCGPASRQFTTLHQFDLVSQLGILRAILGEQFRPLAPASAAVRSYPASKMFIDARGHKKLGRPRQHKLFRCGGSLSPSGSPWAASCLGGAH